MGKHETEILTILMEECAEVIQACSKILRFGAESLDPSGVTSRQHLENELGDVQCLVDIAQKSGLVSYTSIDAACDRKYDRLKIYSSLVDK